MRSGIMKTTVLISPDLVSPIMKAIIHLKMVHSELNFTIYNKPPALIPLLVRNSILILSH